MSSRSGPLRSAWRANFFIPVRSTGEPGFIDSRALASFNRGGALELNRYELRDVLRRSYSRGTRIFGYVIINPRPLAYLELNRAFLYHAS
jgi:hypothetical protein